MTGRLGSHERLHECFVADEKYVRFVLRGRNDVWRGRRLRAKGGAPILAPSSTATESVLALFDRRRGTRATCAITHSPGATRGVSGLLAVTALRRRSVEGERRD